MTYSAEISRVNPSYFVFLVDQSGSMSDVIPGTQRPKANGVADAINRLLQDLVVRCSKGEDIYHYYDISVVGYGGRVGPAFSGELAGKGIVSISEVADFPAFIENRTRNVEDGTGGLVAQSVSMPIWFEPVANGGTPMCQALDLTQNLLGQWLEEHNDSFPPVVFHITDGESTDGDPSQALRAVTSLGSNDGNVLLFNLHLSSNPSAQAIAFPNTPEGLPDQYARMLYESASVLTPGMRSAANELGHQLAHDARGFALNADLAVIITGLTIGTRPSALR